MSQNVTERLDGGLVTSRLPHELTAGELQACLNAVYEHGHNSLVRAPGRTLMGDVGTAPVGLIGAAFRNGNRYLLFQDSTTYVISSSSAGVPFAPLLTGITAGPTLTRARYQDRYFLFNGAYRNQVLRNDGTVRPHGLVPTMATPVLATTTGTFNGALGAYEYWTTEVVEITENGQSLTLENAFEGKPAVITINSASTVPVIPKPDTQNANVTKWRIYRAGPVPSTALTLYPVGTLLTELSADTGSCTDGVGTGSTYVFPGTVAQEAKQGNGANLWTPPVITKLGGDDSDTTLLTINPAGVIPPVGSFGIGIVHELTLTNFAVTGVIEPVNGIEVVLQARRSVGGNDNTTVSIALTYQGTRVTEWKTLGPLQSFFVDYALGGAADTWALKDGNGLLRPWTKTEVESSEFGIIIRVQNMHPTEAKQYEMDYLKLKVHHSGTSGISATAYPAITAQINGVTATFSRNSQPPTASFGCVYQDCLVTNDITKPNRLVWSIPGLPDYIPKLYYAEFEPPSGLEIDPTLTAVGAVGDRLVVAQADALWRVNYLFTEDDAIINRGQILDLISAEFGCLSPNAQCHFTYRGRVLWAFVSRQGLMATDGVNFYTLSDDIAWTTLVTQNPTKCILVNDPSRWELLLLYSTASGGLTRRLHAQYHPNHLKEGGLKFSGPTVFATVTSGAFPIGSTALRLSDGSARVYTLYSDGKLYYDDRSQPIFPNGDGEQSLRIPNILTRPLYFGGGLGSEWGCSQVEVHRQAKTPAATLTVTPILRKKDSAGAASPPAKLVDGGLTSLSTLGFKFECTSAEFNISESPDLGRDFQLNFLTLNVIKQDDTTNP